MSIQSCPKCNCFFENKSIHGKKKFCSRKCSNSRGPRSENFKAAVREKLIGKKIPKKVVEKAILAKGQIPSSLKPNTVCIVCCADTGTKHRKTCSDACYRLNCSKNARVNVNCGGQKRTHRVSVLNGSGERFYLESSFELKTALSLNHHNVKWERPGCVWYTDVTGKQRRYYPDFYLPEYKVYLDPKNSYLIQVDIEKIRLAAYQNKIKVFVIGENYLDFESFKSYLVDPDGTAPPHPTCKEGVLLLN